jgi:hypothetical protein
VKGYRYLYRPDHPHTTKQGYVAEHRLVVEDREGRLLLPDEVVHHIDGDPLNNAPENLMIFQTNPDHLRHELTGRVPNWTQDGLNRMKAGVARSCRTRAAKAASRKAAAGDPPRIPAQPPSKDGGEK